jgi:general secretion pathway protein B
MSFILDALKKSESERQRQTGPALFEAKIAPPRNRFPVWAVVIGVLLAINTGVVAWLLLGGVAKRAPAEQTAAANTAAPAPSPPHAQPASATPTRGDPPSAGGFFGNMNAPFTDAQVPSGRSAPPDVGPANDEPTLKEDVAQEALNPDDFEPAVDPQENPARVAQRAAAAEPENSDPASSSAPRSPRADGLPTYQDVVAMPGVNVPPLRLDLHVYDPKPEARFVFVNMQKLKQGDTLGQGVHVDNITPEGAVLTFRGIRFVLHRE